MYEFRSLKDVHRYLESGDVTNCVMIPNKRKIEDLHITGNQSRYEDADHGQPDADKGSSQCDLPIAGGNNTPSGAFVIENIRENSEDMSSSEPKGVTKGKLTGLKLQNERIPNQSMEHESAAGEEANMERKPKEKKHKTKAAKQIATPLRASPRLAALKINQEANNVPKDEPVSSQTGYANQLQPKWAKSHKAEANSSIIPEKNDGSHTPSVSENAKSKYLSAPEQIQGSSVHSQQVGATADAMPGSALSSLLRSIWSDPCLEFAFRTLTSDIPVVDGTLAVANYLLPSQDLNKGTTPNCSSSAYDGSRSHAQADRVSLPMTRPSDKFYSNGWFPPQ
ncbi:hypothetical protein GUJ93_ZPchr0004g39454 [Zizania palustris]|uniref:MBD domain-containing protein n=1 Tax=Zizania palustris TaxID=103762 RepID=A0A8J5S7B2_ZIZPA|nr:hypothetical protein GUJ93_ZPchr0004g39454 [Zizania palustris]KAG8066253.1 hypothetical protein GUJ93_ZPchr0004g39454 [Zizania palustris]